LYTSSIANCMHAYTVNISPHEFLREVPVFNSRFIRTRFPGQKSDKCPARSPHQKIWNGRNFGLRAGYLTSRLQIKKDKSQETRKLSFHFISTSNKTCLRKHIKENSN
jgi:hypothetical protein